MRLFVHGVEKYVALALEMVVANRLQNVLDYPEVHLKHESCEFLVSMENRYISGYTVGLWQVGRDVLLKDVLRSA